MKFSFSGHICEWIIPGLIVFYSISDELELHRSRLKEMAKRGQVT